MVSQACVEARHRRWLREQEVEVFLHLFESVRTMLVVLQVAHACINFVSFLFLLLWIRTGRKVQCMGCSANWR